MFKKIVSKMLGLFFLGAALLLWVWPEEQEAAPAVHRIPVVGVDVVREVTVNRIIRFPGVTRAEKRAALSFAAPGRLASRTVEVGDVVRGGMEVARLDRGQFLNAVNSAEAARGELKIRVEQGERDLRRVERLASVKAATSEELERVAAAAGALKAAYAAATARLDEARRRLKEATLRAPFSGTVTAVMLEPGEWAGPGRPVVEIAGDGGVELRVEVPESVVIRLKPGQAVTAALPFADNLQAPGRIKSVARAAAAGRLFPVVADLERVGALAPGMTAELLIELETEGALTIPLGAVLNSGSSRPEAFRAREGRVSRIPLRLGQIVGDRVVVHGDLAPGDRIVVDGHTILSDGDVVEVRS
ncbi:MAG: efflux RND transporter periplasmic adaptor subunit [Desulfobacterales bacterium]|nr:efflux RND transporter periplasmic adaptor subunit [Desulfobacterales bacterium]